MSGPHRDNLPPDETLEAALKDPAFVAELVADGFIDEFEAERDAIDELGLRVDGDGA